MRRFRLRSRGCCDAVNRNLTFVTIRGYKSPTDFNTIRSPQNEDVIRMFILRNGVPIRQTGRLQAGLPVMGNVIHVTADNNPWSANLAAIQNGDPVEFPIVRGRPR
jgi:hypothetical protein